MAVALSLNPCDSGLTGNGNLLGENRDIIVAFPLWRGLRTDIQDHRVEGGRKKWGEGVSDPSTGWRKKRGGRVSEAESVFTRRESHTSS